MEVRGSTDSIVHVPLIIRLPHQTDALRMTAPVEQIDIAPTLAALAGLTPPASWEGQSLLPLWHEDQTAANVPSRTVFTMNFEENSDTAALTTGALAVVQGSWKLIRYLGPLHYPNMPPLQDELYDLSSDPGETTNRAADSTAVHERLSELAAAGSSLDTAAHRADRPPRRDEEEVCADICTPPAVGSVRARRARSTAATLVASD